MKVLSEQRWPLLRGRGGGDSCRYLETDVKAEGTAGVECLRPACLWQEEGTVMTHMIGAK